MKARCEELKLQPRGTRGESGGQTGITYDISNKHRLGYSEVSVQNIVKAELLREGIIFLVHLFARKILLVKKLKMEETKATKYSIFKTDIIKVSLLFSISNFFINKIALANIWISFSCSNLALDQSF